MKSGWKTSEWWTTVAAKALSFLVALGAITAPDADAYTQATRGIIGGVFIIATTWLAGRYSQNRTDLKVETVHEELPL